MFDTRLRTLISLIETKNYTKTAEVLYITQPAVTHHIKSIEKENNVKLFADSKTFTLTPSGQMIYDYAIKAVEQYKQLNLSLSSGQLLYNHFSFAVTAQITYFIRSIMVEWLKNNPKDTLSMMVEDRQMIYKKISDAKINFAIVDFCFDKSKYEFYPIARTSIVLVVGNNHSLSHKQKIRIEALRDECLIIDIPGSGIRTAVENELQAKNIYLSSFTNIEEMNDLNVTKDLVIHNCGVAFLYFSAIQEELKDETLKIIEIIDFDIRQDFYLITSIDNLEKQKIKKASELFVKYNREVHLGE